MANSKNSVCGGFVALNTGTIIDCYSNMTVHGKATAAGFCGNNTGVIKNAYSTGYLKKAKVSGGFSAKNTGTIIDCFYNQSKLKSKKLVDMDLGKPESDLTFEHTYHDLDWDFKNVWEYSKTGKDNLDADNDARQVPFLPSFIKKNFYFELPIVEDIIVLSTAEDLFMLAEKINDGDRRFTTARYRLNNDINLKNRKWTPMGMDENNPFSGTFDGAGYSISNLLVNNKDCEYAGFFGIIKDAIVVNLGVAGAIKKGKYSGVLAGVSEGSRIDCCFTNGIVNSSKFPGGFVGKNNGEIVHSFAIGKIKNGGKVLLPLFLGAGALALILGALVITNLGNAPPIYPAIPIDDNVTVIPNDKAKPSDGNSVTFQFDKQIVFQNASSGGVFTFKNPGDSNKNIVVELQLTDAEIIKAFGTTCRTPVEQAKIEAQPGYSPETTRQVIGKSGAIPPGYALDEIKLQSLQDGTALKRGEYNAIIYLVFYDITTNEQAMLNTQMPVQLIITE
ncbi:hypothetical protein [Acetobacterium sp.]|uniref:hypothetical protein n=1 Tax=Acetobacterium sp. TaxID=1872094 RepID=UPI002F3E844B